MDGAGGDEDRTSMVNQTMLAEEDEQEEAARAAYARAVGSRLRAVRKQMRLSLQAVEAMSDQEFKASVLGAYERGERAISVPRLQRLAKLYDVPVDQLLPQDDEAVARWGQGVVVLGEQLVDRDVVELGQPLEPGDRDRPLAAFVGTEH